MPWLLRMLLALVVLVRLGLAVWSPHYQFPDEHLYHELGENLALHNSYSYHEPKSGLFPVRQAPGLPFVLGAMGKVFPLTPLTARLANAAAGSLAVVLLAGLLWRGTAHPPAVGAFVLLAGFHPPLAFASATNYPQSFQALLTSMLLASLVRWIQHSDAVRAGLRPGIWIGLGALFVPTQVFLVPAVWIARASARPSGIARYTAALAVGVLLPVLPWMARNAWVERAFIPFSTSGGEQFALGFNDQAGMNTGVLIGLPSDTQVKVRLARNGHEVDVICSEAGLAWIRENPARAARLWALKLLNFFRWDTGSLVTAEQGGNLRSWMSRGMSLIVLVVGVGGVLVLLSRQRPLAVFALAGLLALAAGHAFFLSRYRYRLPFEPMVLMLGLWGWAGRYPVRK